MEERPELHTVPTELERADAYYDLAILTGSIIAAYYALQQGVAWYWLILPVLVVGVQMLTGEPACDVRGLGSIASGLRSKLGLRRAHEWLLAWAHYWKLAVWPVWRFNCRQSRSRFTTKTMQLSRQLQHNSGVLLTRRPRLFFRKP